MLVLNLNCFFPGFQNRHSELSYFFILAGYVAVIAYYQRDRVTCLGYLKRRAARIYRVYFLAMVVLLVNLLLLSKSIDYSGLLLNVFLLQSWVPGKALSFNFPSWSLSIEFFFYLSFPFLINYTYKKRRTKLYLRVIIGFWIASQLFIHWFITTSWYQQWGEVGFEFTFLSPYTHYNEFLVGNLIGILYYQKLAGWKRNYDLHIVLLVATMFALVGYFEGVHFENGLLAIVFCPVILLISLDTGIITSIFQSKPCQFLGEISYGMYILQVPLFTWSLDLFNYFQIYNKSLIFYSSFAALIIFASLSYLFFEKPLRDYINAKRLCRLDRLWTQKQ